MQSKAVYADVAGEVCAELSARAEQLQAQGITPENLVLDPGFGFGKTPDQNLELLRRLDELQTLGRPLLVGVSRKSTLGKVLGDGGGAQAGSAASVGAAVAAFDRGATMIRAHEVKETVDALAVAAAVERGRISA